jgi:hypothetical protein
MALATDPQPQQIFSTVNFHPSILIIKGYGEKGKKFPDFHKFEIDLTSSLPSTSPQTTPLITMRLARTRQP